MSKPANKNTSGNSSESFFSKNLSKLKFLLLTVVVGFLLGTQIYNPNKRTIEAMAGAVVVFLIWQLSTLSVLWFVLLVYPFPFAISWGNSNFVFMLIIVLIMLIRVSSGEEKFHLDRTILVPFILLVISYIFSFQNVPLGTRLFKLGLVNSANFLSAAAFTFLLINAIDDEEKLRRMLRIMLITGVLVIAFCVFELIFPGKVLISGWLETRHATGLVMKGVRIKGPFRDYELNAEFFTLNSFIVFFMIIRTKRLLTRSFLVIILIIDLFMMFAAVTRGAFFALIAGVGYLMFISRKDIDISRFVYIVAGFVILLFVLEGFVANYTVSGSLFDRVVGTTFEKGLIPDSRAGTWENAMERGMKHPIFGSGPGWDFKSGLTRGFWPHNLYLFYFNSLGLFGLLAFLYLMYKIIKATLPGIKSSLVNSPFPEAFMKILHVMIIVFLFDQIKIEYLRNSIYTFFVWTLFALVIITRNIIDKNREERDVPDISSA